MDGRSKRQIQSKIHENGARFNGSMKNVVYGDENMYETNKLEYPGNTLLRNKGLPEKLEKHLNNEKERELESLYEENRQLLMEISKLRKTNQLLVKDVNKKNEIIDSLDSSLVEVEEKLENVKKKNWNMYNEILNREKDQQEKQNRERTVDSNQSEEEAYNLRASKIGTFNTVDIVKSSYKKESTSNRPKSTSTSTSTENTKWLQDMILESLSEKRVEKRAYDDLKYEVEKLQKEIYSMQTELLKSSQQDETIQEPVIDQANGKLSVFHSTNSLTNNSSIIGTSVSGFNTVNNAFRSTSLAQELKEVSCTANNGSNEPLQEQENVLQEQDQESERGRSHGMESIPPRSVHILMGKTFSKGNNIDRKINKYKNGPRYISENSNVVNNHPAQPVNGYYGFMQTPFLTQTNQNYQQPSVPFRSNSGYYYYSFSNANANNTQYQQHHDNLHPRNCPGAYYVNPFSSVSTSGNHIGGNLHHFQDYSSYNGWIQSSAQHPDYVSSLENQLLYTGGGACGGDSSVLHSSVTNSLIHPSANLRYMDRSHLPHQYPKVSVPESVSGSLPVVASVAGSIPFPTQNFSPYKQSNMPFLPPPFKIKVTQKFRRNRNHSVPLRPKDDSSCSEQIAVDENQPLPGQVEVSSKVSDQEQLPQGYIRFKTSISSPLSQDDYFSPVSLNVNKVCPCDKAINSCAAASKRLVESSTEDKNSRSRHSSTAKAAAPTTTLPLPVALISKKNQFQGTSGLLKFSRY